MHKPKITNYKEEGLLFLFWFVVGTVVWFVVIVPSVWIYNKVLEWRAN